MMIFEFLFGLFPIVIWFVVLTRIIGAVKKAGRNGGNRQRNGVPQGNFKKSDWDGVKRLQNANTANSTRTRRSRPGKYVQKNAPKTEIGGMKKLTSSFGNSGYDVYKDDDHSHGVGKVTSGYSRKLSGDRVAMKKSAHMQYSHTYDGHEPWDKCVPKEKDPWDKDFYRED